MINVIRKNGGQSYSIDNPIPNIDSMSKSQGLFSLEKESIKEVTKRAGKDVAYKVVEIRLSRNTKKIYEMLHPAMVQSLILAGPNSVKYFLFPFIFDILSKDVCTNAQKTKFKNQIAMDIKEAKKIAERDKEFIDFNYSLAQAGIEYYEIYIDDVIASAKVKNEDMNIILQPDWTCLF